jgi:PQQ-dependent catabolism-associated CXXCW motif protein
MRFPSEIVWRGVVILAAVVFLASPSRADSTVDVPEPDGIWTGPMHGPTPKTLTGAIVLDISALDALTANKPVLLDVALADKKPSDFPKDLPWLPIHRSIPDAVWMPGAGAGALDPAREELFYKRVDELTKGDKAKPIVTFCHPECWGSWNTAKRLVLKGYTQVHWFPGGIEGWEDAHAAAAIKPDSAWEGTPASAVQP